MDDGQIVVILFKIPPQERMRKVLGSCSEVRY